MSSMPQVTDLERAGEARARQPAVVPRQPDGPVWAMVFPLALSAFFFWPITRNYFFGDDLLAVYETIHKPLLAFLFEPYGGHVMAARNLVYLLLYRLFGPDPSMYYLVVLLTHLFNVGLLFLIVRDLTSTRLACFSAALWGSAPINQAALGWYQAYGVVLAVAAQLWILHRVVRIRRTGRVSRLEVASWGLLLLAASTCFGTGLATTMAMPAVAWLLLPATTARRRATIGLASIAAGIATAYFIVQRIFRNLFPLRFQSYLLEAAIDNWQDALWVAWLMMMHGVTVLILGPFAHLLNPGGGGEWVVAIVLLAAAGAAFAVATAETRRLMLACLLPFVIGYGAIASGRVVFWPIAGMKLIAQGHYHYTAPLPLAILAALVLAEVARRWQPSAAVARTMLALWFVTLGAALVLAAPPIRHHDRERRVAETTLAQIRTLARSQPAGSDVFIKNRRYFGVGPFVINNPDTFPGVAAVFAVFYPDQLLEGRRIFFVEEDASVRENLRNRPFAAMLAAPETVPADRILHLPGRR